MAFFPVDVMKWSVKPGIKLKNRTYLLTVLRHLIKGKKVIGRFLNKKLYLTKVITFEDEMDEMAQ